jgi:biopolymer transport protein ExbB
MFSFAAVAIIVERGLLLALTYDNIERLQKGLRDKLERGQLSDALRMLERSRSFEARVAAAGLFADGPGSAQERMTGEAQLVQLEMERSLTYLGTLGGNAPLIGLLGTVISIAGTVRQSDVSAEPVAASLVAHLSEGLTATAVGLFVAVPTVVAYSLFRRLITSRLARASILSHDVLAYYKAQLESGRQSH